MSSKLPTDYLERVYAGVLGKVIGVFLGRPFEGWTYQRIMKELGPINYYVHERLGDPLVITDDDLSGTFTFVRALEDHGVSADLTPQQVGESWLNYIIEKRSILWWGGRGNSTEHTAWLNLRNGIEAPASGSIATNGAAVAEQIGAQIFIDGWALVAPGQPSLAAKLARVAGSVSHDGESVNAAVLWAAMEAEAFNSSDINHLLDTGLAQIPTDSKVAKLASDIRSWHAENPDDWEATRARIEAEYGYDRYPGNCHVMPNHALMLMAVLHAPADFQRALMIVNTSGWDTDCNSGNVGCLLGVMHGLDAIMAGPDWRGPVADRVLLSTADGGSSINDAAMISYQLANLGHQLAGQQILPVPKDGARFHFSLPGSVQGFTGLPASPATAAVQVSNERLDGVGKLRIDYADLAPGQTARVNTPTFAPLEVRAMRTYDLMACPLVYPGQRVYANVEAGSANAESVAVRLCLQSYGTGDVLDEHLGEAVEIGPGASADLELVVPDLGGQPVATVGLALDAAQTHASGCIYMDRLGWDGVPKLRLTRPAQGGDFWRRAWVNAASEFSTFFAPSFRVSQEIGPGLVYTGTRQWRDYRANCDFSLTLGTYGGMVFRVQGQRRYYVARLSAAGKFELVRVFDGDTTVLASHDFPLELERKYELSAQAKGNQLSCKVDDCELTATDDSDKLLADGAVGLLVADGALSCDAIEVMEAA